MTGRTPEGQAAPDPLATARGLLEAEAARRGITAAELVGRLARDGATDRTPSVTTAPEALFSDAASATARPPTRPAGLRPPLQTLTWQAPSTTGDDE
ncbi:hypothetical protein [Streptomyces sp. NPDC088812]|uniref:hypothetical protein n=1 Tax=Streptomyces sp. NPDC088812 TaxID=3365905 RepID=UPI0038293FDD